MVSIERRAPRVPLYCLARLAALVALAGSLFGCSYLTAGEVQDIQLDLNQLKREVGRLNTSQADGFRKIEYSLEQIEKNINTQAKLDRAVVSDINSNLNLVRNELTQLAAGRPLNSASFIDTTSQAAPTEDEQKILAAAEAFAMGEYDRAIELYSAFLVKTPDSPEAPNATYYLARCLFEKGVFDGALTGFQQVLDAYPASPIVPEALVSKVRCEIRLNQHSAARATLKKLQASFPEYQPDLIKSIEEELPPSS